MFPMGSMEESLKVAPKRSFGSFVNNASEIFCAISGAANGIQNSF
jgi:hypothetical protein